MAWKTCGHVMAVNNLHLIELNVERNVGLADSEVLALASAWPKVEPLLMNEDWGWNSLGGITPGGFIRLLQTSRSLHGVALARPRHARLYRVVSKSSAGEPRIDVSIGVFDRCRRLYYRICFRSFTRIVISPTCHGATTCGQCTSFCGRDRTTYGHLGRRGLVLGENLWPLSFLKGRPNHLVQGTGPTVWPCSGDSIVWPFSL